MKATFAHTCALRLLRHYPRAWRERYADEAAAVLEERPATMRTLFDLFLGLLDAYLHAELFTERKSVMLQRLRNNQITIFSSFALFTVFWILYIFGTHMYQLGLPPWDIAPSAPNYAFVGPTVRVIGVLAILTTLFGGGAFLMVALKQAIARDKRNKLPFACILGSIIVLALPIGLYISESMVPVSWMWGWHLYAFAGLIIPLSLFFFVLLTLLGNLFRLIQGIKSRELSWRFMLPTLLPFLTIIATFSVIFLVLFRPVGYIRLDSALLITLAFPTLIISGVIFGSVSYLARKVRRLTFSTRLLRLTLIPAALTTLAMLAALGLLLFQVISVDLYVNALGRTLLVVPFMNVLVICIAFPTIFACVSLWRGFKARRELVLAV